MMTLHFMGKAFHGVEIITKYNGQIRKFIFLFILRNVKVHSAKRLPKETHPDAVADHTNGISELKISIKLLPNLNR